MYNEETSLNTIKIKITPIEMVDNNHPTDIIDFIHHRLVFSGEEVCSNIKVILLLTEHVLLTWNLRKIHFLLFCYIIFQPYSFICFLNIPFKLLTSQFEVKFFQDLYENCPCLFFHFGCSHKNEKPSKQQTHSCRTVKKNIKKK